MSQRVDDSLAKIPPDRDPDRDLVKTIVADFLKRHASKNRSHAETVRLFERDVLPKWGEKRLDEITRRDVIALLDGIVDRGASIMANRVLAAVRKLFNWAVSRDILPASPVAGVNLPVSERVLNHVSGSFAGVAGIYNRHGYADEMRRALDAWGAFVLRLVDPETGDNVVTLERTKAAVAP